MDIHTVDRLGMAFENLMGKRGKGGGLDGRLAMYRGDSSNILRIMRVRFPTVREGCYKQREEKARINSTIALDLRYGSELSCFQ